MSEWRETGGGRNVDVAGGYVSRTRHANERKRTETSPRRSSSRGGARGDVTTTTNATQTSEIPVVASSQEGTLSKKDGVGGKKKASESNLLLFGRKQ